MKRMKCKFVSLVVIFSMVLSGCSGVLSDKKAQNCTITGFAFDTIYTITLNKGGSEELLNSCVSKCTEYEKIFSSHLKGSELYKINEIEQAYDEVIKADEYKVNLISSTDISYSKEKLEKIQDAIAEKISSDNTLKYNLNSDGSMEIIVSEEMADILQKGIYYSRLSKGAFDITVQPVSSLWNFSAENPEIPDDKEITEKLEYINYGNISLDGRTVIFKAAGMGVELGGIAKGYIADCLKKYLTDNGVKSGTINLGGNVLCIGQKPDKTPYKIGIQKPFADRNEMVDYVNVNGKSVVSSGIYERCFEKDGKIYHHILDSKTGYPYDNDVVAVTIISDDSVDGDGLSTTCLALGIDKGLELINSIKRTYAVFIDKDGKFHYSEGFEAFK